ncbi:uncharacterized protein LOC130184768 [Seriola aureovittata]|uniref:uncharacterized protein LOC130184768 n=1 Tax=Seriola aureovittata TaxID=2871759 RepID=UPI0024BED7C0|nr:uncharacterized protein LOC130184768 [Seriola aureovittata]
MISSLVTCAASLLCAAGVTWATGIQQIPDLHVQMGQAAKMDCSHKLHGSYYHMYWFQQLPGGGIKLIVHTLPYKPPDFGNLSQGKYSANKTVSESGSLTVKNVDPRDRGVYLCAVSSHSDADTCQAAPKLHTDDWHTTPPALIRSLGDKVQLVCTHGQTDYRVMLWYQQPPGQTDMKLIGYLNYYEVKMEKPYEQHFSIHGDLSQVNCITLHQSLPQIVEEGAEVHIGCSHNDSDLPIMLWYQQREDSQSMTLIVFGYATEVPNYEGKFKEQFELRKESAVKGDLIIRRANLFHSAVYLCAARNCPYLLLCSSRSARCFLISLLHCAYYEAYFGPGTKLTVLEPNLPPKQPTVKVLKPSVRECQNWKDNKQYKTLVCVASDFYPDHVSVFWQIDGGNVTRGVATDSSARRDGKYYRITSRLMVPLIQWYTPEKNFSCTVSFFNGNKTTYSSNWVRGIEAPGGGRYLRITQNAKLSYAVLIVKSSFFGVFVVLLLYKLKGSSGKQND